MFVVLKGASVARTVYVEPCLRSFGDLDLLVRTADYGRACALLGRLGHERQRPEPRPGFEVRFGKASVHRHPDDRIEVDLHRTLVLGPFGLWIDPEELLNRRQTFDVAGRSIGRLDDTGMLLNVAMHASLGRSEARLVPLRDVAQLLSGGRVDWDVLGSWARRWHLTAVMRDALSTASRILGATMPVGARQLLGSEAPASEVRVLQAYQGERRSLGGTSLSTIRAIPGLRNKAAYVLGARGSRSGVPAGPVERDRQGHLPSAMVDPHAMDAEQDQAVDETHPQPLGGRERRPMRRHPTPIGRSRERSRDGIRLV